MCMCVFDIKRKIPSLQVKNQPHVRESKHVFILGSMGNMGANRSPFLDRHVSMLSKELSLHYYL
jgi:hypothetical protein